MNREELKEIKVGDMELPKEVIDKLMELNGKSIENYKKENEKLITEKEALETQLKDANDKIKGFAEIDVDKIKAEVDEWKEKYETDTKNLQDSLTQKEYEYAIKENTNGLKFSSEGAKKSFIRDLTEKGLKLENGNLLGFDDYVKSYQETDPNSFMKEEDDGFKANTGDDHGEQKENDDAFINKIMGLE